MQRIIFYLSLTAFISFSAYADTLTLNDCHDALLKYYPMVRKDPIIQSQLQLKLKQLNTAYFPRLDFSAKASYQSDVVAIDADLPGNFDFPSASHDQYSVSLDISQTLYDGGVTRNRKKLESIMTEVEQQQLQMDLHSLRDKLNQFYLNALLLDNQKKITQSTIDGLNERLKVAKAAVTNGVLLKAEQNSIESELLKMTQKREELSFDYQSVMSGIEALTGLRLQYDIHLQIPQTEPLEEEVNRAELAFFQLNHGLTEANEAMLMAKRNPKLSGFAHVGYGKPGLNMISDEFDTYYIVGARLSWNIFDWNHTKYEKEKLRLQHDIIQTSEQTFMVQLQVQQAQLEEQEKKYSRLIVFDNSIIELKQQVAETAENQFDNGEITSVDLLIRLNELDQAKQTRLIHQIQRVKTRIELNTLYGNYSF